MAKSRYIPKEIRDKLLVDAMHRCCLCPEHTVLTVDLHHIVPISEDGPNTEDNLMVICPNCHARIHRIRTMYTPDQLREYKRRWVRLCTLGLPVETRLVLHALLTNPPAKISTGRDEAGNVIIATPSGFVTLSEEAARLLGVPGDDPLLREPRALAGLAVSPSLAPPPDPAELLRQHLTAAAQRIEGERPWAEGLQRYVPLATRLELRYTLLTRPLGPAGPGARFEERAQFDDLGEAVDAARDENGNPLRRFALLGEPGAGKSTALRKLALRAIQERLADPAAPRPLFVRLGDHKSGTPREFLAAQWQATYHDDGWAAIMDPGADACLWLFADGLNEMEPQGYHQRMAAWRRFLHDELPPRQWAIVACRVADYGNGLDLPRLEIQPLDPDRIQQFLHEYLPDQAEDLWRDLLADRERHGEAHSVYGLAANPFWLTMIVAVYRAGGLPESHADLVERFVDNWLLYEGQRPGGRVCSPEEIAAFKIALSQMAYPFLERGQNTPQPEALARTWLPKTEVEVSGQPVPIPCDETLRLAESINLIVREGRPEARILRFYHHLLLEHFAGRELLRRFAAGEDQSHHWRIPWENWHFVDSEWDPLPGPPTTGWEEATALAAGYATLYGSVEKVESLTRAVLAHNPPLAARCLLESGPLQVSLPQSRGRTGVGAGEVRTAIVARLQEVIAHPPRHLNPRQRVSLRIACGLALGYLGDPRILGENGEQVGTVELDGRTVTFIEPRWCTVPAGPFLMGSDPEHDPDFYEDELPQHRYELLDYDYRIGMYPVTNAEYGCFVRAGGYQDRRWWRTAAARRWLQGQADIEPTLRWWRWLRDFIRADPDLPDRYERQKLRSPQEIDTWRWVAFQASDEELEEAVRRAIGQAAPPRAPRFWDDRELTHPNRPVVGVSWYEASAYCAWLTHVLRAAGRLGDDEEVRLPNEPEWEKAARGGQRGTSPLHAGGTEGGRIYPWGDNWDAAKCNSLEGRVLLPTPVGVYPEGASPCGALDMAGNVWQWTRSLWGPEIETPRFGYPYDPEDGRENAESNDLRVLRGGSWGNDRRDVRCASRNGNVPDYRDYSSGFRVVVSPASF